MIIKGKTRGLVGFSKRVAVKTCNWLLQLGFGNYDVCYDIIIYNQL